MTELTAGSDLDVVRAVRGGNSSAFDEFLRREDPWVRGVVFGVLGRTDRVDDVVQQVWIAVWERISELRDVHRWRPWLYRLARNAAVDAGRGENRTERLSSALADDRRSAAAPTPSAVILEDEKQRVVRQAIESLPAIYRECLVLRHLESWSYRQIAELLELPVDTVETRLVRARRLLRKALDGSEVLR